MSFVCGLHRKSINWHISIPRITNISAWKWRQLYVRVSKREDGLNVRNSRRIIDRDLLPTKHISRVSLSNERVSHISPIN